MLNMTPFTRGIPGQKVWGSDILSSLLSPICILHGLVQITYNMDVFCVLLLLILMTGRIHRNTWSSIQNSASSLKASPVFLLSNDTGRYTGFENPSCFVRWEMGDVEGSMENTVRIPAKTAERAKQQQMPIQCIFWHPSSSSRERGNHH